MKPHRASETARASSVARARLIIKNQLGWLRGFPSTARAWTCVPEPGSERPIETMVLAPDHLHAATRALNRLMREHREALALLVDDATRWHEGTRAILDALNAYVHRGAPVDAAALVAAVQSPRHARVVAEADSGIAPLVQAFSLVFLREPRELKKCLACVEEAREPLAALLALGTWPERAPAPLALAVRLVDAARVDGTRRLRPLLERLGDERSHCVSLGIAGNPAQAVTERRKGKTRDWPEKFVVTLGGALVDLATRLPTWEASQRRRTLALWELVDPGEIVDGWSRFWTRHDALVREADNLLPHARAPQASKRLTTIQRSFKRLDDTKPSTLDGAALVRAVEAVGCAPVATATSVSRVLARLPMRQGRLLLRTHMLFVYEHIVHRSEHTELSARELERLLGVVGDAELAMTAWWESHRGGLFMPARREHAAPDADLASEPPAVVRAFYAALRAGWAREGPNIKTSWRERARILTLETLARLTRDGVRADGLLALLVAAGDSVARARDLVLTEALGLAQNDDALFAPLVQVLDRALEGDAEFDENDPLGLAWTRGDSAVTRRVAELLLAGEARAVMRVGGRARVLRALGATPPTLEPVGEASDADWMDRYPSALRAALRRLAWVDPRARESAARALGKSYPDPQALEREARALRERLAVTSGERARRMRARLDNLEARARSPKASSSAALEEHADALAKLIERRALRAWEHALDAALLRTLAPQLRVETLPTWVLEPPCIELLPHLCALEPPSRKLAMLVLRARAHPYPWDLREEAANRAFLERLARRGIDCAPWIDGIGIVSQETDRGEVYVQLERDPLEALLMGRHFETCLSPGWFNFFSAVSNAADINKRVLYARDNEGTVVGRCLLALTDEGAVLAFHPYCHDQEGWRFTALVSDFVTRLCECMGTQPAPHGTVSNLLCRRWYDDGPVDVTGRFAWTRQQNPGYERIRQSEPGNVLAVVREVIQPLELNALTLPLLIPLLDQRPELAVPFVYVVRYTHELALYVKLRIAELAWRAGARETVRELVNELLGDIEHRTSATHPLTTSAIELFLDLGEAALALRVLKRTRHRGMRRVEDEVDAGRLLAAARACEMLHRPLRARALYQRALGRCHAQEMRDRCQARLAVLA